MPWRIFGKHHRGFKSVNLITTVVRTYWSESYVRTSVILFITSIAKFAVISDEHVLLDSLLVHTPVTGSEMYMSAR